MGYCKKEKKIDIMTIKRGVDMQYRSIEISPELEIKENIISTIVKEKNAYKKMNNPVFLQYDEKIGYRISADYKYGQDVVISHWDYNELEQQEELEIDLLDVDYIIEHLNVTELEMQISYPFVGDEFIALVAKTNTEGAALYNGVQLPNGFLIEGKKATYKGEIENKEKLTNCSFYEDFYKELEKVYENKNKETAEYLIQIKKTSEQKDFKDYQYLSKTTNGYTLENEEKDLENIILAEVKDEEKKSLDVSLEKIDYLKERYDIKDIKLKRKIETQKNKETKSVVLVASVENKKALK